MNTYHEVYETVIGAVMIAESCGAIIYVLLLEPHSVCKG